MKKKKLSIMIAHRAQALQGLMESSNLFP